MPEKAETKRLPRRFAFTASVVERKRGGAAYILEIPERVSLALGRRGPVPVLATLNGTVEIQQSLVPMGGGRHRLQLNARTRGELNLACGDKVRVALSVPEKAPVFPLPSDLAAALREADLEPAFAGLPAGKQNHIILWIEEAARVQTREKRIALALQVAFRARERAAERAGDALPSN